MCEDLFAKAEEVRRPGWRERDRVPTLVPAAPLREFRVAVINDIGVDDQSQTRPFAFRSNVCEEISLGPDFRSSRSVEDESVNPFVIPDDRGYTGFHRLPNELFCVKLPSDFFRPLLQRIVSVLGVLDEPCHELKLGRTIERHHLIGPSAVSSRHIGANIRPAHAQVIPQRGSLKFSGAAQPDTSREHGCATQKPKKTATAQSLRPFSGCRPLVFSWFHDPSCLTRILQDAMILR